ncbi:MULTISPECIES: hypothetical protein [unclassified Microcoleus]|uniref:hypothetical protein n=1 Tax=unclassified Microcoleus TaxID=2642155 RepID=UPI002FD2D92E
MPRFNKEYIRRAHDNQVVIRVAKGTEVTSVPDCLDDFLVEASIPITKNLGQQIYLSKEEVEEYLGEQKND